jgi:dolichyl-phosphate beta-glucosyltransferase
MGRWCFDVEIVYLCKRLRIPMAEVSVSWTEIPGSKVRMTSILHMVFELLLVKVGYGLGIWKIYS